MQIRFYFIVNECGRFVFMVQSDAWNELNSHSIG